jgi:hypothetical protein
VFTLWGEEGHSKGVGAGVRGELVLGGQGGDTPSWNVSWASGPKLSFVLEKISSPLWCCFTFQRHSDNLLLPEDVKAVFPTPFSKLYLGPGGQGTALSLGKE